MRRRKESRGRRNKTFGTTARRTHRRNVPGSASRGGIRL